MTDPEFRTSLGNPCVVTLTGARKITGIMKDNGDGTYSADSGFGKLENTKGIVKFTAAEVESVNPQ